MGSWGWGNSAKYRTKDVSPWPVGQVKGESWLSPRQSGAERTSESPGRGGIQVRRDASKPDVLPQLAKAASDPLPTPYNPDTSSGVL